MNLVCLGEILVDLFPAEVGRELTEVSAFHPKPGGAPANVAVAASRLGYQSAFIGKVGVDAFGSYLARVLAREGDNTRGLRFDPLVRTTLAFISKPDANSYDCLFYRNPGADTRLRKDELDLHLIQEAMAFQFGSLSLTDEPSRSATMAAIQIASSADVLVCYDVNYRPSLWESPEQAVKIALEMAAKVNMIKVNDTELSLLTGGAALETAARNLRGHGPSICVVTLGAKGSYIQMENADAFMPAFPVKTVDAAGCGDAFLAALLCQMTNQKDWRSNQSGEILSRYLRYANAAGALAATRLGTIPSFPTTVELLTFLKENS